MFGKKSEKLEHILILGLGGIGFYLAKRLLHEGYSITAIESDPKLIHYADGNIDARLINGNALSIDCWKEAQAGQMDYLIAVTDNDAVNMLSSMIADRFGIKHKIARVRSLDFGNKDSILKGEDLKIDLFIHPEELASREIVRLIRRTAGNEIIDVALGQIQVMATRIAESSPLANKTLIEISQEHKEFPFRVVAIARGITTIIPGGKNKILPQDQVLIMAAKENMPRLMAMTGVKEQRRHRVMILGGGLVGSRIAELLGKTVRVKLIEKDPDRAEELSQMLHDTDVLHGDGSIKEVLEAAGLLDMDTFIAATEKNEANIMSCLLVKHLMNKQDGDTGRKLRKTISLVNKEDYVVLAATSGSDIALNKKILAGNEILTFIRQNELLSVSHMHGFDAEVVDLLAGPDSAITRKPLAKLSSLMTGHMIVGSVFRDGKWETAVGDTHIHEGDRAIVVCTSLHLKDVRKMFM
ncbi:MAG: Trk system potassium transporter TrkA [Desulfobulbaceae bacterium]|uniref:Trk system potassium uptake protein TrkA n=1 Tax=Candidatus Desulfobia pelagia TaxID=2841692 RepID=A0A8J6TFY3_9BACT|nr:Trk system potassium transporter TrkA [Candidatus Desulfobia pelagia]